MHVGLSLDRRDDWYTNVGYVLEDLNTFIVHLTPHSWVGDVTEGREVDRRNELTAGTCENGDLVGAILRYPIEGLYKLRVILRGKGKWTTIRVELGNKDSLRIPASFKLRKVLK